MVRNYVRKTNFGSKPQHVYDKAVKEIQDGQINLRGAAKKYDLNVMTLHRYRTKKIDPNLKVPVSLGWSKNTIFSQEQENELVSYTKQLSRIYFGLSGIDLRNLAFQFGQVNNIKMPSNWYNNCRAGGDWLYCFLKRNNDVSLRTHQATSSSRATSFNRHNVKQFFENLCELYDRFKFEPHNIFNIDEAEVTIVHEPSNIIAIKGAKQVDAITSRERGTLVTVALAVNAVGNALPPMFIFPQEKMEPRFLANGPAGSIGSANSSGSMTGDEFLVFIRHFSKNVKPSNGRPVLLLLDNHESHLNIEVLNFCKLNGIVLLSFPPHCSHKLQPLDQSVFRSFKTYSHQFNDFWMQTNHGKRMSIYVIPSIVKQALPMAATMSNIQSDFKVSGIWPYNPNIFTDEEFLPNSTIEQPDTNNVINVGSIINNIDKLPIESSSTSKLDANKILPTPENNVSLDQTRPFPKGGIRKTGNKRRGRKRKSAIPTETLEKDKIQNEHNIQEQKKKIILDKQISVEDSEEETSRPICSKTYSQSKASEKSWVQCFQCKLWTHVYTDKNPKDFTCVSCSID